MAGSFQFRPRLAEPDPPPSPARDRPVRDKYDQRAQVEAFARQLQADDPLLQVLHCPRIEARLEAYEDANATAVAKQVRFYRLGHLVIALTALSTIITALSLLPVRPFMPETLTSLGDGVRAAANIAQTVFNLVAIALVWLINRSRIVDGWLSARAEAERLRGEYFVAILFAPLPAGSAPDAVLAGKLALFEKAHLDYQRSYFESAIRKHEKALSKWSWPRIAAGVATILALLVIVYTSLVASGVPIPGHVSIAAGILQHSDNLKLGLNTMASALLAYAGGRAALKQDERNAVLYRSTLAALDALRDDGRSVAAAAAAAGELDVILEYAAEAQAILDADHRIWMLARPRRVARGHVS